MLYGYIYKTWLEEKYNILNEVLKVSITEEETENFKAKHIKINSEKQNYEHCMEIKIFTVILISTAILTIKVMLMHNNIILI